jgi:GNAT superfamily N-acetyltransferase
VILYSHADVNDAAAISELTRHVVRTVNSKDYTPQEIDHAFVKFSPEYFEDKIASRIFYIATLDHELVGQASFGEGKIHTLFVDPKFQGQGIGAELLTRLEIAALEAGIYDISLSSSVAAKGFYEKFGYSLLSVENSLAGVTYLMEKRLVTK